MRGDKFSITLDGPPPVCLDCGRQWPVFGAWVAAHWHESLTHKCWCGARYEFCNGEAKQVNAGKKRAAK